MRVFRAAARNIVSFVFPPLCAACGVLHDGSMRWLCPACAQRVSGNAQRATRCPRCSINTAHRDCTCDIVWDFPFERIFSLLDFDDTTRQLMHQLKYGGMWKLGVDLGAQLACHVPAEFWAGVGLVCPVPLHAIRRMRRGYNQSDCVARGVLSALDLPGVRYEPHLLHRRRHTKTQTKLDKEQRQRNLANAFEVRTKCAGELAGQGVVLVDDVVTTGATTGLCAEVLMRGGARFVRVLSLVRD